MAYYLSIKNPDGYRQIDVSKLDTFKRLSRFKKESYSLDELDKFTGNFIDENHLKHCLLKSNLITEAELTRELSIRIKRDGKLEKVMYDIFYNADMNYLDYRFLSKKLLSFIDDKKFLEKLVKHYRNSHSSYITISVITNYLKGYPSTKEKIFNYLNEFFIYEVFSVDKQSGSTDIKYKSLHDLAAFIIHYEKENRPLELSNQYGYYKQESFTFPEVPAVEPKKRVKSKKMSIIEGQMSLFDE